MCSTQFEGTTIADNTLPLTLAASPQHAGFGLTQHSRAVRRLPRATQQSTSPQEAAAMSASARMGWAPREPSAGERQPASGGAAGPDNAPATAGTVAADATPQPGPAAGGDTLQAALAEARLTAAVASVESEERSAGLAAEGAAAAPAGASRVRAGNGGGGGGGGGGAAQASAQEAGPAQAAQAQTAVAPRPGPGASPAAGAAAPPGAAPPAAAAPAPPPALGGTVAGLVAGTRSCVLRPCAFFVSWQGVLTLAFRRGPRCRPPCRHTGARSAN